MEEIWSHDIIIAMASFVSDSLSKIQSSPVNNVHRLQRIHRYNVLFLKSLFHVMENSRSGYNVLSLQYTFSDPPGSTL